MGSGHILVYAFDVLMQIYLSCGYTERDAAQNIVRNNLWGLDLDKRAYQLAYFAVMMKARQYDRRFLTRGIKPNLSHFQDLPIVNYSLLDEPIKSFVEQFENADTYGSLITVQADDEIDKALDEFQGTLDLTFGHMEHLMRLYKILSQRYDVVCTNPPYMGISNANAALKNYVEKVFPDSRADLFSVFIEKCSQFAKNEGYFSMITQHAWMFISTYERLREKLQFKTTINMAHLGARAFDEISGEKVQTTAFVFLNTNIVDYLGVYNRLVDIKGENQKRDLFLEHKEVYYARQSDFGKIEGCPVSYWLPNSVFNTFIGSRKITEISDARCGMNTRNNDDFLRLWHEISYPTMNVTCGTTKEFMDSKALYTVYNKGGSSRKWYAYYDNVIKFNEQHYNILLNQGNHLPSRDFYFRDCITWTDMSTKGVAFRYQPKGSVFDGSAATSFTSSEDDLYFLLGLLNSKYVNILSTALNPTLHFKLNDYDRVPVIMPESDDVREQVIELVKENVSLTKVDWDSFETSWDFKKHPFIRPVTTIKEAYEQWEQECNDRRAKLKANEEELNRIFIEIYGLQDELTPEVEDKDITVRAADLQRDMRSFVSYAVGCMFGRYSLDTEGLAYAGGEWDESKYKSFIPDKDNCLPITEEHFFEDDIVTQFANFVQAVFGEDTLEDNLRYVAENLGIKGNGTAREKIRQYFLKEFYKDHCKVYQKRPIYWLFDTGKKNGFKALCYIHRWTVNTVGDVRIDYMHKLQRLYRNEINRLKENIDAGEEIAKSQKRLEKITNQLQETEEYDAKIGIVVAARTEIDLDDGVKVNYDKVQHGSDGKKYQILATI